MLRIIDKTNEIANFLGNQDSSILKDYRITVKINMEIEVQLLVEQEHTILKKLEWVI